ncbi:MAG: class I SAM-dependent methyltransferase [Asgard group archaeon]|nr:class I SAM-dependent methyltransferase [Asgard group archaeon]
MCSKNGGSNLNLKKKDLVRIFFLYRNFRAKRIINRINRYFKKSDRILDIGSGLGTICSKLLKRKHKITPLDIKDLSIYDNVKTIIYNGIEIPFKRNHFDVAFLLLVLHHTPNPKKILIEAKRVVKRIIITEDVYSNVFQKYLAFFWCSLLNLDFFRHPHSNKTDSEWRELFRELNLKLIDVKYHRSVIPIVKQVTYFLNDSD